MNNQNQNLGDALSAIGGVNVVNCEVKTAYPIDITQWEDKILGFILKKDSNFLHLGHILLSIDTIKTIDIGSYESEKTIKVTTNDTVYIVKVIQV